MSEAPTDRRDAALPAGTITVLLAVAIGIGPTAHYLLSALGPSVIDELGLTRGQFGSLWVVTFAVAAGLSVYAGRLTDRTGPRAALVAVLLAGTAALLVLGVAGSYWWVVLGLALAGCAQSASNAATNRAVLAYFPPRSRNVVVGIKQSGVQLGQLVAGVLAPVALLVAGWRTGFLALAAVGLVALAGVLRLPNRQTDRAPAGRPRMDLTLASLVAYAAGTGVVLQAVNVHLPLFAYDEHGFSAGTAGLVTAALGGVGVLSRLAWGRMPARWLGSLPALRSALLGATAVAIVLLWCSAQVGVGMMWLGIVLFGCSAMAANVIVVLEVLHTHPESIGYASSYLSLGMMAGFMVGPPLFGVAVDARGGYPLAWSVLLAVTAVQLAANLLFERAGRRRSQAGPGD